MVSSKSSSRREVFFVVNIYSANRSFKQAGKIAVLQDRNGIWFKFMVILHTIKVSVLTNGNWSNIIKN